MGTRGRRGAHAAPRLCQPCARGQLAPDTTFSEECPASRGAGSPGGGGARAPADPRERDPPRQESPRVRRSPGLTCARPATSGQTAVFLLQRGNVGVCPHPGRSEPLGRPGAWPAADPQRHLAAAGGTSLVPVGCRRVGSLWVHRRTQPARRPRGGPSAPGAEAP